MRMKRALQLVSCVGIVLMMAVAQASDRALMGAPPPNMLTNPSFDDGGGSLSGWFTFGNAFLNAPDEPSRSAPGAGKMFGNFWGVFNVTGILQAFPAAPGQTFTFSGYSHVRSADPMIGVGPPDDNWAVMKIAFFDAPAGGNEIGGAEVTIATGQTVQDQWHFNTVTGTAPCGTQRVEALFLFLQPLWDGGAVFVDDASFELQTPTTVALDIKPQSCPNSVNPNARGSLPIAILGMEGFDVSQIDTSSLLLDCAVAPVATNLEDVGTPFSGFGCACSEEGPDGYADLTLKFNAQDVAAILTGAAEQELTLSGTLLDGTPIEGRDCVRIVPQQRANQGNLGKPDVDWSVVKRLYR